jgi:hypothetical protein
MPTGQPAADALCVFVCLCVRLRAGSLIVDITLPTAAANQVVARL